MKDRNTRIENRKYPRITRQIPFKLKADDFVVATQTINLSCIGVSCQAKESIPFMTRVKVIFALPCPDRKSESICVECYGVVVRIEEVLSKSRANTGMYNIAIFFDEIEDLEREKLSDYIRKML